MITVTAASQTEALAVVCASLVDDGSDVAPFRARALVVSGEGAWGRLVDAAAPLALIPTFEEPDVATALDNGHRVLGPGHPDTVTTRRSLPYRTGQAGDAASGTS